MMDGRLMKKDGSKRKENKWRKYEWRIKERWIRKDEKRMNEEGWIKNEWERMCKEGMKDG